HSSRCAHPARGHPQGRALPRSTIPLGVLAIQGFGPSVALAGRRSRPSVGSGPCPSRPGDGTRLNNSCSARVRAESIETFAWLDGGYFLVSTVGLARVEASQVFLLKLGEISSAEPVEVGSWSRQANGTLRRQHQDGAREGPCSNLSDASRHLDGRR